MVFLRKRGGVFVLFLYCLAKENMVSINDLSNWLE